MSEPTCPKCGGAGVLTSEDPIHGRIDWSCDCPAGAADEARARPLKDVMADLRARDPLTPAMRRAFEASWKRDEAAYRYLAD